MELWESDSNCIAATHPVSGQQRVSLTGRVINAARNVAFLVTGDNKADKVKEIVTRPEEAAKKYPAARVHPESGNLFWFLDQQAAQKLTNAG
jgi:6-phosphogluconolactonase